MKEIAFFPLPPLGDSIVLMGQLEELHRLYFPCRITVFAIPLIAELYRNYKFCNEVVVLEGGIRGAVKFIDIPKQHFDVVINHGYDEYWTDMLRQMNYDEAYGMEEISRPPEICNELFTKWVSIEDWKTVTLKQYQYVSEQMAEVIRLLNPAFRNGVPHLSEQTYACTRPEREFPEGKYALLLPGTSALCKYWPVGKYLQMATWLKREGFQSVFVLGPQDMRLRHEIAASAFYCFESLSLSELAYCIVHASIVIGNDMEPMHLAACFDVLTVHFFSFTGASNWFQYAGERHKLVMSECGLRDGCQCGQCVKSCIGKISVIQACNACAELLGIEKPHPKKIAYFAQSLIGDALVNMTHLEELSRHYSPCEITVFCTKNNAELFQDYAYCDRFFCYEPGKWSANQLPQDVFEAVFNTRYDYDSILLLQSLRHCHAYGYENCEIPPEECKKNYDAWLPLSMWDDRQFRYATSVTEQGASLVRLVSPAYHCQAIHLAENTFMHDYSVCSHLERNTVLFLVGASSRYKHWGMDNYLRLAQALQEKGYHPLFLLGPRELDYKKQIDAAGLRSMTGMSFAEIAALMNAPSRTECIIGNDTGLMHLACAFCVNTITISADEARWTWFPYDCSVHGLCAPVCSSVRCSSACSRAGTCVTSIAVEDVLKEFCRITKHSDKD